MKTISFEIAEQLAPARPGGKREGQNTPWSAPDWYIQSVSGGMGPLGVLKGL
jgi:threonine synthase